MMNKYNAHSSYKITHNVSKQLYIVTDRVQSYDFTMTLQWIYKFQKPETTKRIGSQSQFVKHCANIGLATDFVHT